MYVASIWLVRSAVQCEKRGTAYGGTKLLAARKSNTAQTILRSSLRMSPVSSILSAYLNGLKTVSSRFATQLCSLLIRHGFGFKIGQQGDQLALAFKVLIRAKSGESIPDPDWYVPARQRMQALDEFAPACARVAAFRQSRSHPTPLYQRVATQSDQML